jgi:acetyltransferase
LNKTLPPFWSHANPIDLLGDATAERYRIAVEACGKDPSVQGVLVLLSPQAMTDPTETARQLAASRCEGKPVLASWMGGATVRPGRELLSAAGVPTFDAPEAAIQAFLHMVQYRRSQELLYERPEALPEDRRPDSARVRQIIQKARGENRTLLTEAEAKDVLAAYGLPVARTMACADVEQAVRAAADVGYPVVLKLLSSTVTHKSDVGGVQLSLGDEGAVRSAFSRIQDNLGRRGLGAAFGGVTVQPMIASRGFELIIGSSVDRQFGPVILFGAGGVLVEVMQDRALALPPLNRTLARRLMERTQIYTALKGVRGQAAVNLEVLETLLVYFSQLLIDFAEIHEVDINPLLAGAERIVALDARIVLAPADQPEDQRPHLVIRPYPNQYTQTIRLRNGEEVRVRAMRPEDEPLIIAMHARHSENTIRMRYFSMVKTLSRDSLIRLCHLDYDREMALAAVTVDGADERMLGVSRYYLHPETGDAEFALIVSDAHQRLGLGRQLLRRLIEVARERGVKRLVGLVLSENAPMLALTASLGFTPPATMDDGVVRVELGLDSTADLD